MKRYHLLVLGGTTPIENFVEADGYWTEPRAYCFFNYEGEKNDLASVNKLNDGHNRAIQCVYPINLTIIKSIEIL